MPAEPAIMSFSGGKDSMYALHHVQRTGGYAVRAMLTTVSREFDRISMHGVRRELLLRQAAAIRLPLEILELSSAPDNGEYVRVTNAAFAAWKARGVQHVIFGDLFLADLRTWREEQLKAVGMQGVFPIWRMNTRDVSRDFINAGFKAVLVCIDLEKLAPEFAGRSFDQSLLDDLPPGVDPCGENGEFHTFVYDGPLFDRAVPIIRGEAVTRGRFRYQDLLMGGSDPAEAA